MPSSTHTRRNTEVVRRLYVFGDNYPVVTLDGGLVGGWDVIHRCFCCSRGVEEMLTGVGVGSPDEAVRKGIDVSTPP